jgi:hypothetical protein
MLPGHIISRSFSARKLALGKRAGAAINWMQPAEVTFSAARCVYLAYYADYAYCMLLRLYEPSKGKDGQGMPSALMARIRQVH